MRSDEIDCQWAVTTAPTDEPITLDEAKLHARITDSDSDGVLASYITTAREAAESYMGRGILTQTITATFSDFASVLPLPMASPLQSVTSVKYYDADGVLQTLSTDYYDTDTYARPARLVLKPNQTWPSLQADKRNGRVEVVYVVGWANAALVPEQIKQGIRLYVTYCDMDRDGLTQGAQQARQAAERCWSDRIWWETPSC